MLSKSIVSVQIVWSVHGRVLFEFTFRTAVGSVAALIIGARLTVAGAGTSAADRAESIAFLKREGEQDEMKRGEEDSR